MTTTQASIRDAMQKVYTGGMTESGFKTALAGELGRRLAFPEVKAANEFFKSQQEARASDRPAIPEPVAEPIAKTPRETYFESLGVTSVKMSREAEGRFTCGFAETGAAMLEIRITEENGMPWVEFKQFLGISAVNMGLVAAGRLGVENNVVREHIPLEVNPGRVHLFVEKVGDEFVVHAAYKLDPPKPKEEPGRDPAGKKAEAKRGIINELMKGNFGTVELLETDAETSKFIRELLLKTADLSGVTDVSVDALCTKANEYVKWKKQTPAPAAIASVEVPKGPTAQEVAQALLAAGFADTVRSGITVPQPRAPATAEEVAQALLANTTVVDKVVEGVVAKLTESKGGFVTKVVACLKTTATDAARKEVGDKIGTAVKTLLETGDELKKAVTDAVKEATGELREGVTSLATDIEVLKQPIVGAAILEHVLSLDDSTTPTNMAGGIKRLAEEGYGFDGSQKGLSLEVLEGIANGKFDQAIEEQFGSEAVGIAKERTKKVLPEYQKLIGGESS